MELQITLSGPSVARRVADALDRLGHAVRAEDPACPGQVVVRLAHASDAPLVHRIAAMLDHPSAVAA